MIYFNEYSSIQMNIHPLRGERVLNAPFPARFLKSTANRYTSTGCHHPRAGAPHHQAAARRSHHPRRGKTSRPGHTSPAQQRARIVSNGSKKGPALRSTRPADFRDFRDFRNAIKKGTCRTCRTLLKKRLAKLPSFPNAIKKGLRNLQNV